MTQKTTAEYKTSYITPFGPRIAVIRLPDLVIDKLISITDKIISDENRINAGPRLAGQLQSESSIPLDVLKKEGLEPFFEHLFKEYVSNNLANLVSKTADPVSVQYVEINEAWVNSMYKNEYNPIHWHDACTMSSTLYLKVPEYEKRNIPGKTMKVDGDIVFITDNPSTPSHSLQSPTAGYSPKVGDMFIWPSRLLHTVYPFQGSGERRSVAMNATHTFK